MTVQIEPIQVIRPLGANLQDLYASGDLCPMNEDIELYTDDFTAYTVGSDISDPPWSTFKNANIIFARQNSAIGSVPVVRMTTNATPAIRTQGAKVWNQGYTNFNTTQCGVWISCKLQNKFTTFTEGVRAGLVIGCMDVTTTTKLLWNFQNGTNSANGCIGTNADMWGAANNLVDSAAIKPAIGDTCKFRLTRTGAYGWRIEAEINGVVQGSSTSALVQLSNANPKSLGFFASIDDSGGTLADFWEFADVRMGVC